LQVLKCFKIVLGSMMELSGREHPKFLKIMCFLMV